MWRRPPSTDDAIGGLSIPSREISGNRRREGMTGVAPCSSTSTLWFPLWGIGSPYDTRSILRRLFPSWLTPPVSCVNLSSLAGRFVLSVENMPELSWEDEQELREHLFASEASRIMAAVLARCIRYTERCDEQMTARMQRKNRQVGEGGVGGKRGWVGTNIPAKGPENFALSPVVREGVEGGVMSRRLGASFSGCPVQRPKWRVAA